MFNAELGNILIIFLLCKNCKAIKLPAAGTWFVDHGNVTFIASAEVVSFAMSKLSLA